MIHPLDVPCAHGAAVGSGRIRVAPEDFLVREWLGFAADGEGSHWLLTVRKCNANTQWVARQLARIAGVHPRDVGFAGLKDRNAVTEQAFTVPAASSGPASQSLSPGENDAGHGHGPRMFVRPEDWLGIQGEGFEVVAAARHRRKLRRGALRGNDFEIVVRDFDGAPAVLDERLAAIGRAGVPNYFGPQRFGTDGRNLDIARRWFASGSAPQDRTQRSFALSAARSTIFNAVLAERVRRDAWNVLQPGDIANLDGSGSIFAVDGIDDVLRERCSQLDIHPTGPLWGAGTLASGHAANALEQEIAAREPLLGAGLARAGLEQERRALRIRVGNCAGSLQGTDLRLRFRLPRGAYATAVLHEIIADAFAQAAPETDEE